MNVMRGIISSRAAHYSSHVPQAQRVGDHGNGAEGHRGAGQNGAEQQSEEWIEHAGGDRDSQRVVGEGKKKILADVAHGGAAQSARARTMPRRSPPSSVMPALSMATSVPVPMAMPTLACARARRVVHSVAGHGHDATLGLQLLHDFAFLVRQHARVNFIDAEFARDRFRGGAAVAGEHHDANFLRVQTFDGFRRGGLHRIGNGDQSERVFLNGDKHHGLPVGFERVALLVKSADRNSQFREKRAIAERGLRPFTSPVMPLPGR